MKKHLLALVLNRVLIYVLIIFGLSINVIAANTLDIYPAPPNAIKSEMFSITVDDKVANVIDYMDYHYMHIGFDANISITVTANENINTYKISPLSLDIKATVNNNQLTFDLSQSGSDDETPRYLVIQINNLEKLVILGDLPEKTPPTINSTGVYNVTAAPYSADSTGVVSAQTAIQQAIDEASKAGGGIVYVPYGLYTIKENLSLKSNVELYLAPGSVLKAIDIRSQYIQNSTLPPALIIHNANNAKITGRGEIDGSGFKLMSPPAGFTSQSVEHPRRRVVQLDYSTNIELNGIIVKDATGWTVELMRSENLIVQNLKVLNHKDVRYKIENDGIDAVSSSNTLINQCFVITIDDAFCSKARYTDMDNCVFSNNVSYNWSGGVKAGMQSVGNMTNILFRNCDVIHCRRGVAVDTREGQKPINNVEFRDIRVEETEKTVSGNPFCVEFESELATISDIKIVRLTCLDNNKMRFRGDYKISNIIFEDLRIKDKLICSEAQLNITKEGNAAATYQFNTSIPCVPTEEEGTPISTYEELNTLIRADMDGTYYLTNDIEIPEGTDWLPLGKPETWDGTANTLVNFTGSIDGRGFSVKNLKITTVGNFSAFISRLVDAEIKNLGLENVDITGGFPTGALAGVMFGTATTYDLSNTIENVFVTGSVKGTTEVGGLVGRNNNNPANTIRNCYANVTVEATNATDAWAGGIVGSVVSGRVLNIKQSYAAGTVKTTDAATTNFAGSIVGYINNNNAATVITIDSTVVALNELSGGTNGIVLNRGTLVQGVVNLRDNQAKNNLGITVTADATLVEPAVLLTHNLYTNTLGWDFTNVWKIEEGVGYPTFSWMNVSGVKSVRNNLTWNCYPINSGIAITSSENLSITVFAITGKVVNKVKMNGQVNIHLNKGIYLVKANNGVNETNRKVLVL